MTSIGTLFAFVLVCAGVMDPARTRARTSSAPSGRRCVPVVSTLGILICGT